MACVNPPCAAVGQAHHGDHVLFEDLDADADGQITLEEWLSFLIRNHTAKEAEQERQGDQWVDGVLHTLEENTKHRELLHKHHRHQHGLDSESEELELGFMKMLREQERFLTRGQTDHGRRRLR